MVTGRRIFAWTTGARFSLFSFAYPYCSSGDNELINTGQSSNKAQASYVLQGIHTRVTTSRLPSWPAGLCLRSSRLYVLNETTWPSPSRLSLPRFVSFHRKKRTRRNKFQTYAHMYVVYFLNTVRLITS